MTGRIQVWLSVLTLVLAAPVVAGAAPDPAYPFPIRVFLFTAPAPQDPPTGAAKDRLDSVKDLKDRLFGSYKGIALTPAPDRAAADLVVEVTGREMDPEDDDQRTVHLSVRAGDHTFTIDGKDDDGEWRAAAEDGSNRLRRWIRINYEMLVKQRPK